MRAGRTTATELVARQILVYRGLNLPPSVEMVDCLGAEHRHQIVCSIQYTRSAVHTLQGFVRWCHARKPA
jgi:hypothetical protein